MAVSYCIIFTILVTLVPFCTSQKIFLLGGATKDDSSDIYNGLRLATGIGSPKIAVAISGASSLAVGKEAYFDTIPGSLSYEELFKFYGFQPSLIELAIDNFENASSSATELGRANIALVEQADVYVTQSAIILYYFYSFKNIYNCHKNDYSVVCFQTTRFYIILLFNCLMKYLH